MTKPADPLPQSFFRQPTIDVARGLLGRWLIVPCRGGARPTIGRIVETEAYIGEDDPACHASRGRTPGNDTMYDRAGLAYVYFTYGHHWLLNCVTEPEEFPAAALIRALEPIAGLPTMRRRRGPVARSDDRLLTNGPGKLTQAMGIDRRLNGADLRGPRIVLARGDHPVSGDRIATSGRVGVTNGNDRQWRFFERDSIFVSAYRRGTRTSRRQSTRETAEHRGG